MRIHRLTWNVAAVFLVLAGKVYPAQIVGATAGDPDHVFRSPYLVTLTPIDHLSGDPGHDLELLRMGFRNWHFDVGTDAPGEFNVLQYSAFIAGDIGGADFTVLYDDKEAQAHTDYMWIQIARFHNWGRFSGDGAIDDNEGRTDFPFYANLNPSNLPNAVTPAPGRLRGPSIWNQGAPDYPRVHLQNPARAGKVPAGDLIFEDEPRCALKCADIDGVASATFALYLVNFDWNGKNGAEAGGNITIRDGIRWGVTITTPEPSEFVPLCGLAGLLLWVGRRRGLINRSEGRA
jgi:hypothetical protein